MKRVNGGIDNSSVEPSTEKNVESVTTIKKSVMRVRIPAVIHAKNRMQNVGLLKVSSVKTLAKRKKVKLVTKKPIIVFLSVKVNRLLSVIRV